MRAGLGLFLIVQLAVATSFGQAPSLEVGERFPEIQLPLLDGGGTAAVSSFRGRRLVLHIWASW